MVPVDLEGTDEEDVTRDAAQKQIPETITRSRIVKMWNEVDHNVKTKFIQHVDNMQLDGA